MSDLFDSFNAYLLNIYNLEKLMLADILWVFSIFYIKNDVQL